MLKSFMKIFVILGLFLSISLFVGCSWLELEHDNPNDTQFTGINVTGVSLESVTVNIILQETLQLTAQITPEDATIPDVSWFIENEDVASVDISGLITALGVGTTTLTVSTFDGGFTAVCSVTVGEEAPVVVAVSGVSLNKNNTTIVEGNTEQLIATVEPGNATNQNISWDSSNDLVGTVSSLGVVSAVSSGTAIITVTTEDGGESADCTVTVEAAPVTVTGVSLNQTTSNLTISGTVQLTATVEPGDATNQNISWSSSNDTIASVNGSGFVTAESVGSAVITVTTEDSGMMADCTVNVSANSAGDTVATNVGSSSFVMVYVPGTVTFFTGTDDAGDRDDGGSTDPDVDDPDGEEVVPDSYWIAETELIYALWDEVYIWATGDTDRSGAIEGGETAGAYNFVFVGEAGSTLVDTSHPVTSILWRDALVWCNALTEYVNEQNGSSLVCVYQDAGVPMRDSSDSGVTNSAIPVVGADGYRMLTLNEWELAARYIDDGNSDGDIMDGGEFYPGDYASGATASVDSGSVVPTQDVAWFAQGSSDMTHDPKGLNSNALGIYDMSGNVGEWVFDYWNSSHRSSMGGAYNYGATSLKLAMVSPVYTTNPSASYGFRFGRSAD